MPADTAFHRCARGALLLAGLSLVPSVAGAQRAAPGTGSRTSNLVARTATDSLEAQAAARVADAVCGKRVVLLGELPEHAHARGFGVKARVVERLVSRCGFRAVLFEAGSYDFFGLERAIAATRQMPGGVPDSLDLALARAIGGLWWTRELADWRRWLLREAVAGRVAVGGLDDQPIGATAAWARAMLPGVVGDAVPPARAAECREAVARHVGWRYTATQRYDSTERARLADCTRLAAGRAPDARASKVRSARALARRTPDHVMLDNLAGYFAREREAAGAPDRDLAMAQNFAWWLARLPQDAKIVVWTASTHAARARGARGVAPVLPLGVLPLGARLAQRWNDRLAVIGFTALEGRWGRAGQPAQALAPLPPDALEARALAAGTAGDGAGWAYLDRAALRARGPAPSRLFQTVTTDWSAAFDGVLVIRHEAAPTYEPRR